MVPGKEVPSFMATAKVSVQPDPVRSVYPAANIYAEPEEPESGIETSMVA